MMRVEKFVVSPIQENTYIAWDETLECVIIDCGCFEEREWSAIKNFMAHNNLRPVHLLNTHLHFDHAMGIPFAHRDFGLSPEANDNDLYLYNNMGAQLRMFLGVSTSGVTFPPLKKSLSDGDIVTFGNSQLHVLQTPGHSKGGLCFCNEKEKIIFTGDTLFRGSIGRTDLEGGNYRTLMTSIMEKIDPLPDDMLIYPGHGNDSTLAEEKRSNPYM